MRNSAAACAAFEIASSRLFEPFEASRSLVSLKTRGTFKQGLGLELGLGLGVQWNARRSSTGLAGGAEDAAMVVVPVAAVEVLRPSLKRAASSNQG